MLDEIAGEILLGGAFLDLNFSPCYPYPNRFKERDMAIHENEVLTGRHLNNKLRFRHQYLPRKSRFGVSFQIMFMKS